MTYFQTNKYPWYCIPELGILGAFIIWWGRDPAVSQRQFYVEIQAIHDGQNIAY